MIHCVVPENICTVPVPFPQEFFWFDMIPIILETPVVVHTFL